MIATILDSTGQEAESATLRQIIQATQFFSDRRESWLTRGKLSNQSTMTTPRTISGYFPTRRDMQLARAESLAG